MQAILIKKAFKFRIYPNKKQEILIVKTIGCSRFVFNHFLAKWNNTYKKTGKGLSYNTCSKQLTQLKKELTWLKEVDSIAMQSSLENLSDSFLRFFKKQNKAPRFKSKKNDVQSYKTKHTNGNIASLGNYIKLPKLGRVRFAKNCGHQDGKKSLEIRTWTCPTCHKHYDRDINASKNILAEGLRTLTLA